MNKKYKTIFLALAFMGILFPAGLVFSDEQVPEYSAGDASIVEGIEGELAIIESIAIESPEINLPDTIILSDDSSGEKGLVIYRTDGTLWVNTVVGNGNESAHSASYFGQGDFVVITTSEPFQCAELSLNECRGSGHVIKEIPFSIQ